MCVCTSCASAPLPCWVGQGTFRRSGILITGPSSAEGVLHDALRGQGALKVRLSEHDDAKAAARSYEVLILTTPNLMAGETKRPKGCL